MALPNRDNYFPNKTIYILKAPPRHDGKPWQQHGVSFNAEGRGATTSFRDKDFLIKTFGYKDITKQHWANRAKQWEKLVKAELKGKPKETPEPEVADETEKKDS